ncbi:MAG: cupin domain-containing protein [Gemmatimonadota bacterium]
MSDGFQIDIDKAMAALPSPPDEQYMIVYRHGTLEAGIYAPRGADAQSPHARDEVYVVVQGRGVFICGTTRKPFTPGELLFVPAGTIHCFEDFTDDLTVWVMFYGPPGGEDP